VCASRTEITPPYLKASENQACPSGRHPKMGAAQELPQECSYNSETGSQYQTGRMIGLLEGAEQTFVKPFEWLDPKLVDLQRPNAVDRNLRETLCSDRVPCVHLYTSQGTRALNVNHISDAKGLIYADGKSGQNTISTFDEHYSGGGNLHKHQNTSTGPRSGRRYYPSVSVRVKGNFPWSKITVVG